MIDGDAIREIAALAKDAAAVDHQAVINGVTYVARELRPVFSHLPAREPLALSTLAGLADYVIEDPDDLIDEEGDAPLIIHIDGVTKVSLVGPARDDDHHSRETIATAGYAPRAFAFGQWIDREPFNIGLQALFQKDVGDWQKVLQLVSTVMDEQAVSMTDNGVSQSVATRKGVVLGERTDLPNPVTLAPYRSFADVQPVASLFILRAQGGGAGQPVKVALFECDGGRWQLDTVQRITDYFAQRLVTQIAAKQVILVR